MGRPWPIAYPGALAYGAGMTDQPEPAAPTIARDDDQLARELMAMTPPIYRPAVISGPWVCLGNGRSYWSTPVLERARRSRPGTGLPYGL